MRDIDPETQRMHRRALRDLLASHNWQVFAEYLQRFREVATINLIALKKDVSDDFLRGQIQAYNYLLFGLSEQLDERDKEDLEQMQLPLDSPPVHRGDPYGESTSPESE